MLNKFFFAKSLLISSCLVSISSSNAMFSEDGVNTSSASTIRPNNVSLTLEEQKPPIALSSSDGYQGEESFVATIQQIRTAFNEKRLLVDPSGRHYRITSLIDQTWALESIGVCMQSQVNIENFGKGIEKRHLTGIFKPLTPEPYLLPIFDEQNPVQIIGYSSTGIFDVLAERVERLPNYINTPLTLANPVPAAITTLKITEEIKDQNKKSTQVFKEPDRIENNSNKTFHAFSDSTGHYGFELLTPEHAEWWKNRLGACAYMQYGKESDLEDHEQILGLIPPTENIFADFKSSNSTYKPDAFSVTKKDLINMCSSSKYDAQYKELYAKQASIHGGTDYLGAWRGFKYNLETLQNCPIWVAYTSLKPIEGPLCKNTSVTSPDIRMEMTFLMSETFYGPLGIFGDPITQAAEKEKGNMPGKQLSMTFHSATARFVKLINPQAKYMIVRPIESMRAIFKKSGIQLSESYGSSQNINYPYIRYVKDVVYTWDKDSLTDAEKENFGDSPYILIDPRTNEYHQISHDHWFCKNPFLGGMDFRTIAKYPLVTIDIEDLSNFSK